MDVVQSTRVDDRDRNDPRGIGLALSGGGFRSALFGLGALDFVVEQHRQDRLRLHTISSVSGGSYVNARALLIDGGLTTVPDRAFVAHFRPFVRAMTTGSPFRSASVLSMSALMAALGAVAISNIRAIDDMRRWLLGRWHWLARPGAVLLALALIPTWGRTLARAIWNRLFPCVAPMRALGPDLDAETIRLTMSGREVQTRGRVPRAVDPRPDDEHVEHVIGTTDLHHDGFTYLSDDFVYNRTLGHGSPGRYTLKAAVDASTAIPPIFAPVRLWTDGFVQLPPNAPKFVLSADGGLHDTLAIEWFRQTEDTADDHERIQLLRAGNSPARVLVVDGSAPLRRDSYLRGTTIWVARKLIPIWWWVAAHARSAYLAMSNWDRRNFAALNRNRNDKKIGISIADMPFTRIEGQKRSDQQLRELAKLTIDWRALVRANGAVGTRPHQLSEDRATKLLYHGYVMAWAALAREDPPTLPTIDEYHRRWLGP